MIETPFVSTYIKLIQPSNEDLQTIFELEGHFNTSHFCFYARFVDLYEEEKEERVSIFVTHKNLIIFSSVTKSLLLTSIFYEKVKKNNNFRVSGVRILFNQKNFVLKFENLEQESLFVASIARFSSRKN